ncbi:MAG TPA: hypothetical protein VMV54_05740 [Acidocella sp.]|nr:hypothetical protein [Acidocella sp.]
MADAFLAALFGFGRSTLKGFKKDNPDPAVFIAFAVIFVAAVHFVEQIWPTIVVLLVLVVAYCWRRDRSEQVKIEMAKDKLDAETARIQVIKQGHRAVGGTVQPSLPLNPRSRRTNNK